MNRKQFLSNVVMSVFMSACMSLTMAIVNLGLGPHLLYAWARGWAISFLVALPLVCFIVPHLHSIVGRFYPEDCTPPSDSASISDE
ncbi:DUF2798 domain-containing protein [Methanimicrococcus sp. OttesenSCG-928-J09]|nr:DUF2798 domain-containing protein [Methanimicrococcus sp. OttesenSCG-928-J09]